MSWRSATGAAVRMLLSALLLAGCPAPRRPAPSTRVAFWHTFNAEETATLNGILARLRRGELGDLAVRSTVVPFAQALNAFRRAAGQCKPGAPELLRAELPWIPELAARGLIVPLPADAPAEGDLLAPARRAARYRGRRWALPASLDCLALLYDKRRLAKPPASLDELVAAAKRLTVDSAGKHVGEAGFDARHVARWGFYVRADAYWFLPFLWAAGARLFDARSGRILVDSQRAVAALQRYASLSRGVGVAPPRPSLGDDYEDQLQRFSAGQVAMIVNGPWATAAILGRSGIFRDRSRLRVAPFPRAPDGEPAAPLSGHAYVVSRCAKHPRAAWKLARALVSADAEERFARRNALLPALAAVYKRPSLAGDALIQGFARALAAARERPQHPAMARIFDDFTPAVQAVLLGDATAREALAGVARAWRRRLGLGASSGSGSGGSSGSGAGTSSGSAAGSGSGSGSVAGSGSGGRR